MPIFTSPQIRVSVNKQQRTTIRTVGISPATTVPITKLTDLDDVDATGADNNETLVYDSTIQKYVVKPLPLIDGGSY
jgi:hypothetical protein